MPQGDTGPVARVAAGALGVALTHAVLQVAWGGFGLTAPFAGAGLALEGALVFAVAAVAGGLAVGLGRWAPAAVQGVLLIALALSDGSKAPGDGVGRTVVWITVDTLRRDYVSAYPDAVAADLTPEMDAIFAEATRYEQAVTTSSLTLPSHFAMLSGQDPTQTGLVRNNQQVPPRPTAVQRLRAAGFAAGGFTSSAALDPSTGIGRDFDTYSAPRVLASWDRLPLAQWVAGLVRARAADVVERPGVQTVAEALDWLDRQPADASVFLWVHLNEPHEPRSDHPEQAPVDAWEALGHPCEWSAHPAAIGRGGVRAMRAARDPLPAEERCLQQDWTAYRAEVAAYGQEVRAADAAVGALVDGLAARGRWDRAGVVISADHGEDLVEHQALPGHQFWLSEAVVRVPLAVRDPACGGCAGAVRRDQVDLAQVASTLLRLGGLSDRIGAGPLQEPGPSRVVTVAPAPFEVDGRPALQVSARYHDAKVILDQAGYVQRYRLVADPAEKVPWVSESERDALRARVDAMAAAWAEGRPAPGSLAVAPPRALSVQTLAALAREGVTGKVYDPEALMLFAQAERIATAALARALESEGAGAPGEAETREGLRVLGYAE